MSTTSGPEEDSAAGNTRYTPLYRTASWPLILFFSLSCLGRQPGPFVHAGGRVRGQHAARRQGVYSVAPQSGKLRRGDSFYVFSSDFFFARQTNEGGKKNRDMQYTPPAV